MASAERQPSQLSRQVSNGPCAWASGGAEAEMEWTEGQFHQVTGL